MGMKVTSFHKCESEKYMSVNILSWSSSNVFLSWYQYSCSASLLNLIRSSSCALRCSTTRSCMYCKKKQVTFFIVSGGYIGLPPFALIRNSHVRNTKNGKSTSHKLIRAERSLQYVMSSCVRTEYPNKFSLMKPWARIFSNATLSFASALVLRITKSPSEFVWLKLRPLLYPVDTLVSRSRLALACKSNSNSLYLVLLLAWDDASVFVSYQRVCLHHTSSSSSLSQSFTLTAALFEPTGFRTASDKYICGQKFSEKS